MPARRSTPDRPDAGGQVDAGPTEAGRGGDRPRLTDTGRSVASASVAVGVLGWALGYPVLTLVALGGIVAVAASVVFVLGRPELEVTRTLQPIRVDRGQPALGVVSVTNLGSRRSSAGVAEEPVGSRTVHVRIPALAPGTRSSVPYRLPTNRRGAVPVGPMRLVRRDPLGLWEAGTEVGGTATLWVRPRIERVDARPGGRTRHLEGPTADTAPQGSITFHALREYVVGDDLRKVHWRTSARTGTLMVRQHVDTSLPSTVVVIDTRAPRYGEDGFEEAVDVAASIVEASHSRGFPVKVTTTGGERRASTGGQSAGHLLDFLSELQPDGRSGDLTRFGSDALGSRDHDALVVVAGRVDQADIAAVASLGRPFSVVVLATVDGTVGTGAFPGGVRFDAADAVGLLQQWRGGAAR